jgi:hypothetical protein
VLETTTVKKIIQGREYADTGFVKPGDPHFRGSLLTRSHPMKKDNGVSVPHDESLSRARALNDDEVVQLRFDPLVAKHMCKDGLRYLHRHRGTLADQYPGFDLEVLGQLPVMCDRIVGLQYELSKSRAPTGSKRLIDGALSWRRRLMPIAQSLAINGKLDAKTLADIQAGTGTVDNVQDVLALTSLLADHQRFVEAACDTGALTTARTMAEAAMQAIKSGSPDNVEVSETSDLRDRYATLVERDVDRLRLAVAALTSSAKAEAIVGPIRGGGHKAKSPAVDGPVDNPS